MGRPWMIVVVGALVASTPLHAQRDQQRDSDSDDIRSRIDTTVALAANGTVDLSLVSGEIVVTSWERGDVRVRATSEEGVLRLDASPSRVSLSVRSDRGRMGDSYYEVTMPAAARLIARGVSGSINSRGGSEVEAHSVSGEVDVSDVSGRTAIETVSGDVRAQQVDGGVRAVSVSGEVVLSNITGDVDARSVSGDIVLDGVRSSFVRSETTSGDVQFDGSLDPDGRYTFNSHSGDIELTFPRVGATMEVQTFSGDVDSDYPMTLLPGAQGGERSGRGGQRLRFTINGGGARVSAQTFSGDVTITGASGANREN